MITRTRLGVTLYLLCLSSEVYVTVMCGLQTAKTVLSHGAEVKEAFSSEL